MTAVPIQPRSISRRRRWTRRLLFALLVLLIVIVIAIQSVLWTSVPRQIVVAQLQRELGLRTSAARVETGWFGHTTLHDVTLGLPLSDDAFVRVPTIDVRHTNLVPLLLGRSINLRRIELDRPVLQVRQENSGAWNIQRAIDLIARTGGSKQAEQSNKPAPIALPELIVHAARVTIIDNTNHSVTIEPIEVKGWRDGALVYRYDLAYPSDPNAANLIRLVGQLAPAGRWDHELNFTARQVDQLLKPLIPAVPNNLNLDGEWIGRVENGTVDGRLDFKRFTAAKLEVEGGAAITASADTIRIKPTNVIARTQIADVGDVRVTSGELEAQRQTIRANELELALHDGRAIVSGQWNGADHTASGNIAWRDIAYPQGVSHSGSMQASLTTPWPGKPGINATLNATALSGAGSFETQLKITGQGESLNAIDWNADIQRVAWQTVRRRLELNELGLALRSRDNTISIDRMTLAGQPTLRGAGAIDTQTQQWWLWTQSDSVSLAPELDRTLAININAWGDRHYREIRDLYLRMGHVEIVGFGTFDARRPKPFVLELTLAHLPLAEQNSPEAIIRGELSGALTFAGTTAPVDLQLNGNLRGRGLHLLDRELGDLQIDLEGEANANTARIHSTELDLLGGRWRLTGAWPLDRSRPAKIEIGVSQLPLTEITKLLKAPQIGGVAGGIVLVDLPLLKPSQVRASGNFSASNVSYGTFSAERATASVGFADRMLRVSPLQLFHDNGSATATINLATNRPTSIDLKAELADWPLEYAQGFARTSGTGTLTIDLARNLVNGPAHFTTVLSVSGRRIGNVETEANLRGNYVEVPAFRAQLLEGSASGRGSLDWIDPLRSRAQLSWEGVNLALLTGWVPQLEGLTGTSAGQARLGVPDDPHPLGPLQFEWNETVSDGKFRGLSLGGTKLKVFFDRDRIVTEGSQFMVADGTATLFARATRRRLDNTIASLASVHFEKLDLNQIVHAVKPQADPMPGRAAGTFRLAGDPRNLRSMFGDGDLHLTESDLANFNAVGGIYDLMHLSLGAALNGTADVRMRLDGENLEITEGRVFNRGVEIIASGSAGNVWELPRNKFDITAVGSARPLKNIKLPFFADVDKIFKILQTGLTPVKVGGTLEDPQIAPAVFGDLSQGMKKILLGDVQAETKGSAGQ